MSSAAWSNAPTYETWWEMKSMILKYMYILAFPLHHFETFWVQGPAFSGSFLCWIKLSQQCSLSIDKCFFKAPDVLIRMLNARERSDFKLAQPNKQCLQPQLGSWCGSQIQDQRNSSALTWGNPADAIASKADEEHRSHSRIALWMSSIIILSQILK